jgi:hypothetical protein
VLDKRSPQTVLAYPQLLRGDLRTVLPLTTLVDACQVRFSSAKSQRLNRPRVASRCCAALANTSNRVQRHRNGTVVNSSTKSHSTHDCEHGHRNLHALRACHGSSTLSEGYYTGFAAHARCASECRPRRSARPSAWE